MLKGLVSSDGADGFLATISDEEEKLNLNRFNVGNPGASAGAATPLPRKRARREMPE